jgi:hypothetical protein
VAVFAGEDAVAVGPGRTPLPRHVRRHCDRLCRPLSSAGDGRTGETNPQVFMCAFKLIILN